MGKKGSWLSAIKTLCTSHKNQVNEADKKTYNKGRGKFKHGSFLTFRKEPSSIEEILGEVDQRNLFVPTTQSQPQPQPQPQTQPQPQPQPQTQPQPQPQPQPHTQPHTQPQPQPQQQQQQPQPQPQPQSQPQTQPQPQPQPSSQPQPTSSSSGRPVSPPPPQRLTSPPRITSPTVVHQQHKITQRSEPTLQQQHLAATKIQSVYRGYRERRKVRSLTGLVRLQRVVTSPNVKRQTVNAMKKMQLLVRVQTQIRSQRIQNLKNQALKPQPKNNKTHKQEDEDWDDSVLTKEEKEARLQRKEEALIKRERAMAYAYSHQSWKGTQTPAHQTLWWNWVERQLPYHTPPPLKNHQYAATPSRSTTPRAYNQLDTPTRPTSSKSTASTNRLTKYSKERKGASFYPTKDDDSLMSCPPFSVPHYMSPTVSARAKARPASNPKERSTAPSTPGSVSSNRRFSFPFTPNTNNKHKSPGSIGDLSMDSMPTSVGRKPFNRFV